MTEKDWFSEKFKWLRNFAIAAAGGIVVALILSGQPAARGFSTFLLIITILPLFFWLVFIPIIHWKERYKGDHPYIWGGFLVFETSGWSKIFYWFMHVLPDYRGKGLYRPGRLPAEENES